MVLLYEVTDPWAATKRWYENLAERYLYPVLVSRHIAFWRELAYRVSGSEVFQSWGILLRYVAGKTRNLEVRN